MLADIQRQFTSEIISQASNTENKLLNTLSASIYRNNIYFVLTNALKEIYPCVYKLVGEDFFRSLAHQYIYKHPSTHGDLNNYGAHLAEFIAAYSPAKVLVYLSEVAQLEWAYHQVFYAARQTPIDINKLTQFSADDYEQLIFMINPSCQLLNFKYPILRIWQLCQTDISANTTIDINEGGVNILVRQQELNVVLDVLSAGEFTLLKAFQNQEKLTTACEQALEVESDLAIDKCINKFLGWDVFIGSCVSLRA